jgi:hypothetical protein
MKGIITILITAFAAVSCNHKIHVYTDHDASYDARVCKTYAWTDVVNIEQHHNPVYYNQLNDKRIREAVDFEMAAKGYVYDNSSPELLIHYHIVVNDKAVVTTDDYGYFYSPYWLRTRAPVYQYSEGTFIIDVMDSSDKNLIWRGWAVTPLERFQNGQELSALINESVQKIFEKFPRSMPQKDQPDFIM